MILIFDKMFHVEHFLLNVRSTEPNIDKVIYLLYNINSQAIIVKKRKISDRYMYIPVYSLKKPFIGYKKRTFLTDRVLVAKNAQKNQISGFSENDLKTFLSRFNILSL